MKAKVAESQIVALTEANFESEVLNSEMPVIVDFWADWCPPCRALSPIIDDLASEYGDRVRVAKLDVDTNKALAAQYEISSIPTVMLFANGEVRARWVGLKSKGDYAAAIDKLMNKPTA